MSARPGNRGIGYTAGMSPATADPPTRSPTLAPPPAAFGSGRDPLPPALRAKLGDIPAGRVVLDPPPGTATAADHERFNARRDALYELIDGTLIEKAVSDLSGWFDGEMFRLLANFVRPRKLGYVHPASTFFALPDGLRAPDAAHTPRDRRPDGLQARGWSDVPPALVVEVLSPGNTRAEMDAKRHVYFTAGVELVWEVDPLAGEVAVWRADTPDPAETLTGGDALTGDPVLPGFTVTLTDLFADPLA